MRGVKVIIEGEYACFSRPELKVERVSYDVITPSAARGILEAVFWKPAIKVDGKMVFTNAGALFFRKNSDDMAFEHSAIVCAVYKGISKVYILDAQEYNTNIVDNIDSALLFLKRNLRTRYEIKVPRREEILELPEAALKEAVINAVCHRNYFEKGAHTTVEIFDDRVEITSPGGAPSGITDANFGKLSVRRNPIIASMLHRIDYVERMGTGIERMRRAADSAGVEEPSFDRDGFFKVLFTRDELGEEGKIASEKTGRKDRQKRPTLQKNV